MPPQRASAVQCLIYPLTAGSRYWFGSGKAITPANYWANALRGATDEWGLSYGYRLISPGDWVWAYFGGAVRQICGVGTVRSPVGWRDDWGRHTVHIRWDKKLTARLKTHPIGYDDYRQPVQGAAVRANPSTRRVLDDWLKRVDGADIEETASGVKFAERAVTQRLGQPLFRAKVLRAYGGVCAITGCAEANVLQAAHISPVAVGGTHAIGNAILLRADVHNVRW